MTYTVTWPFVAKQRLAEIWLAAESRSAVTAAADRIDHVLKISPYADAKEFYGDYLLIELPLGVVFTISESDLLVKIIDVWHQEPHGAK